MGSAQSSETRKISIPNDGSYLRVSESVLERLEKCKEDHPIGDEAEPIDKKKKLPCPPDEQEIKQMKVRRNQVVSEPGDPLLNYYYGPSLTSLKILQEKENDLKETEKYWSRRIQNLEEHHAHLSNVLEKEYDSAVREIKCKLPRPPANNPQPCCEGKKNVIDCYKKNPNQVLLCAREVSAFANCVESRRVS